jgi:hypothetical protein
MDEEDEEYDDEGGDLVQEDNEHDADNMEDFEEATTATDAPSTYNTRVCHYRVCAMCVKEPALRDGDDDDPSKRPESDETRRLRLRERKTIERQKERQEQLAKQAAKEARRRARMLEEGGLHSTNNESSNNHNSTNNEGNMDDEDGDDDNQSLSDDDDDPFLKAIGGADNLLIGEAYQQKLLNQHKLV